MKTDLTFKYLLTLLILLLPAVLLAQFEGFHYKALITENGNVLANKKITIRFSIIKQDVVYTETVNTTTDENGIVTTVIGECDDGSGTYDDDFCNIDWRGPTFLKVEIDTGNGFVDYGTNPFYYVPFAKYAVKAGNVFSGDYNDLINKPDTTRWDTDSSDDVKSLNDLSDVRVTNSGQSFFFFSFNRNNTGAANLGLGYLALNKNADGHGNIALGNDALGSNTAGNNNLAIGYNALNSNVSGSLNIAIGEFTLTKNIGPPKGSGLSSSNIVIGHYALENNITGYGNVVVGTNGASIDTSGHCNVYLGYEAASNSTGSNNIFIGYKAGYNETGSNKLYIENSSSSTPLIGGDFSKDYVTVNGKLGVGVDNPSDRLQVGKGESDNAVKVYSGSGHVSSLKLFEGNDYGFELQYDGKSDELNLWSKKFSGNEAIRTKWYKNGNVEINGKVITSEAGDADLKAYIYGSVRGSDGYVYIGESTGGFTLERVSTGVYKIKFNSYSSDRAYVIVTNAYNSSAPVVMTYSKNNGYFNIYAWNLSGNHVDTYFNFVVYKR